MPKRHVVQLTEEQRAALVRREDGLLTRRQRNRVQVLRRSHSDDTNQEIADDLSISVGTVANVRRRFTLGGLALVSSVERDIATPGPDKFHASRLRPTRRSAWPHRGWPGRGREAPTRLP